ncbi:hypothetical protein [Azohydromonas sp.]|uniref:hypothetical protein n=1 Tax=Azohydromonas sp. TaxID=1872666 RepID=UPI002D0A9FF6|nr:hypothetical protein [Azohydromonas sp.]HMM87062.1 hypothetical protein [Azohydromonas sp.]
MAAAKTTAERVRAHRERLRLQGLTEVRGAYARPEDHERVRTYARKLAAKPKREGDEPPA